MQKSIYISLLCLFLISAAQGQDKKYVYKDSTLVNEKGQPEVIINDVEVKTPEADAAAYDEYPDEELDTSLYLNNLSLPADSIQRWKDLKQFAYAKYLDSLLKKAREKEDRKVSKPTSRSFIDVFLASSFVRALLWILAIAFVLFVLYSLFLADGAFRKASKNMKQSAPEVEEEVITGESDFDKLILQSLQEGNYRQAVRCQYLKTLHKLADKGLVELAKDKTNFQYVHEISDPVYKNEFASLTLHYEYVWYGEFALDRNIYQKIDNGFNNLNRKL